MIESQSELKMMTKRDFLSVRNKYNRVSEQAEKIIESARDSDVLVLKVQEGSRFNVLAVRLITEESEDEFVSILKEGIVDDE